VPVIAMPAVPGCSASWSMMVRIDASRITDQATFHSVFAEAFGFPGFYGQNMDAWIDCMTHLDDPSSGLS
jgi:hypothetical protein